MALFKGPSHLWMFPDPISLIFFSSICISWGYLMHYCKPATSCTGKIRPHAMVLNTDYGRPTKPFFHWNLELLGLGRQIRKINSWTFGVFSAKLLAPTLVHWLSVFFFIFTRKNSFYNTLSKYLFAIWIWVFGTSPSCVHSTWYWTWIKNSSQ